MFVGGSRPSRRVQYGKRRCGLQNRYHVRKENGTFWTHCPLNISTRYCLSAWCMPGLSKQMSCSNFLGGEKRCDQHDLVIIEMHLWDQYKWVALRMSPLSGVRSAHLWFKPRRSRDSGHIVSCRCHPLSCHGVSQSGHWNPRARSEF